LAANSKS